MNIDNILRNVMGKNNRISNNEWVDKGNQYYTYEWYNPKLNKTIVIQKETSGKYIVQLFSGGGSTLKFNKFLSKSLPLTKAKIVATKWMKK